MQLVEAEGPYFVQRTFVLVICVTEDFKWIRKSCSENPNTSEAFCCVLKNCLRNLSLLLIIARCVPFSNLSCGKTIVLKMRVLRLFPADGCLQLCQSRIIIKVLSVRILRLLPLLLEGVE